MLKRKIVNTICINKSICSVKNIVANSLEISLKKLYQT